MCVLCKEGGDCKRTPQAYSQADQLQETECMETENLGV